MRSNQPRLVVAAGSEPYVPGDWFTREVPIARAAGAVVEAQAETLPVDVQTEFGDRPFDRAQDKLRWLALRLRSG